MIISKCVFIGAAGAGKTQLLNRINERPFNQRYNPTIGVDFFSKTSRQIKLQIWDTAGQKNYRSLTPLYYRSTKIAVFCIDLSKEINTTEIQQEIATFKEHVDDASIFLVGTKSDLCPETAQKKINDIQIEGITERFCTSAKNETGLEQLLDSLIQASEDHHIEAEQSLWEERINQLQNSLKDLPADKKDAINRWSRYLVIDFSHPWLKSTRQRAKCLTPTVLRPARCAERASVCLPQ